MRIAHLFLLGPLTLACGVSLLARLQSRQIFRKRHLASSANEHGAEPRLGFR